jgi:DNA invertase Pin-like site-specific DNA recombinase
MSVFGGMSKGERNRIKLRVRAMAAQAAIEGRFLGGRPPYDYRIADAGLHPNPAKARDAGADPQTVAEWTRQVKAERAAALARDASQTHRQASRRLTEDDDRALITSLGDLRDVIRAADPAMRAAIYGQLGLKVTYLPGQGQTPG